jgi:hypothetical protein
MCGHEPEMAAEVAESEVEKAEAEAEKGERASAGKRERPPARLSRRCERSDAESRGRERSGRRGSAAADESRVVKCERRRAAVAPSYKSVLYCATP